MSTVDKALSVLDLFSESRPSIGLSEVARLLDKDKASVQRYLVALLNRGFLDQDPVSKTYHLGPALHRLALVREQTYPVETGIRSVLTKLVQDTGETAHSSHIQKGGLSEVAIVETSFKGTRVYIDPAELLPLHASASGLAYLSALPAAERRNALGTRLEKFTPSTATNIDEVIDRAGAAAELGYAKSAGTYESDVVGMAAPVFGANGRPCGAVAIATPGSRFNRDVEKRNAPLLIEAAKHISHLYGARSDTIDMNTARGLLQGNG